MKNFRPKSLDPELELTIKRGLAGGLVKLAPAIGLIYFVVAIFHLLHTTEGPAQWLAGACLVMAALFFTYGLWLRSKRDWLDHVELQGAFLAITIVAVTVLHLVATDNPIYTINLMVLMMGAGVFLLSTRIVLTIVIAALIGWLAALIAIYDGAMGIWLHYGAALFCVAFLAMIVHRSRAQNLMRMDEYVQQNKLKQEQLEDALDQAHEAQDRYMRLSEATEEGILIHKNGRILDANESITRMFGYSFEELLGMSSLELALPRYRAMIARAIASGTEEPYEVIGLRKDGSTFVAEICGKILRTRGEAYRVVAIRDVSERKRAEKALQESETWLRLITRQIPAVHWTTDEKLHLTSAFGAGMRPAGLSADDLFGKTVVEMWSRVENRDQMLREHEAALAGESREFEFLWDRRFYRANIEPLRNQAGEVIGTIGVALDVTRQKRTEAHLMRSLKEKEILLKEIHHRVKNNMQIISSLLTLQARTLSQPEILQAVKESQDRIRSMALVHENLYQSSDMAHLNFAEYVRQLTASVFRSYEIRPSQIELRLDVEPVFLDLDFAIPFGLILNELVTNAIKHAFPPGHVGSVIEVGFRRNGESLILRVRDNGIGISEERRVAAASSLGLQLVASLTEQIHGRLHVNTDRGTLFEVEIPDHGSTEQEKGVDEESTVEILLQQDWK